MKRIWICAMSFLLLSSCHSKKNSERHRNKMMGTWKLVSGTTIQGKDTVVTDYTKNKSFLKIINATHFSFVDHDLKKGKDSATAYYVSGAGKYTLTDSSYTEHLEYCSDRGWEGNDFTFHVVIQNDSLTQTGIEKVEKLGVNRLNIEKYVRFK
jgi:hypothetical protein